LQQDERSDLALTEDEDRLEERVKALEDQLTKSKEKEAAAKAAAAAKPTQKWTGRIHADYWAFPGEDDGANVLERGDPALDIQDRFLFRRIRLGMQGTILETMLYKSEMDFNDPSDPAIKDVYFGFQELPILRTLLFGHQKRPYGLDHLNSSRYNVFIERPLVVEAINQDARRFGLCSYGVSENLAYNWRFGTYMLADMQNLGTVLATDDPGEHHYQAELAGRFANTLWYDQTSDGRGYAHWAMAGTVADPDGTAGNDNEARFRTRPEARTSNRWINTGRIDGADTYELLALEGVINVGALQWVGEYQHVWLQRDVDPELQFHGGYMYLSYFLTGEHVPWDRERSTIDRVVPFENFFLVNRCDGGLGRGLGAWQLAARYSYADFTVDDIFGGAGSSFTFALNWHWTAYSKMQFNYILGDIDDGPGGVNAHYNILGARFMVDF
jgi:phosphate-selective porin OprO/OprP